MIQEDDNSQGWSVYEDDSPMQPPRRIASVEVIDNRISLQVGDVPIEAKYAREFVEAVTNVLQTVKEE